METLIRTRQRNVHRNATIGSSLKDDAILALELIQQKSRLLGLDTMTLNDINNEIKQARYAK